MEIPANIRLLSDQEFIDEILRPRKKAIILFQASWCGPCRRFLPIFSRFITEMEARYTKGEMSKLEFPLMAMVDTDEFDRLIYRFGLRAVPETLFMVGKHIPFRKRGVLSLEEMLSHYETHLRHAVPVERKP